MENSITSSLLVSFNSVDSGMENLEKTEMFFGFFSIVFIISFFIFLLQYIFHKIKKEKPGLLIQKKLANTNLVLAIISVAVSYGFYLVQSFFRSNRPTGCGGCEVPENCPCKIYLSDSLFQSLSDLFIFLVFALLVLVVIYLVYRLIKFVLYLYNKMRV